jgi:hypothetical protein
VFAKISIERDIPPLLTRQFFDILMVSSEYDFLGDVSCIKTQPSRMETSINTKKDFPYYSGQNHVVPQCHCSCLNHPEGFY